jgi:hypothetical protein
VNGRRYRASTETADKHKARAILDGRHGIRRQPDVTFRQFAALYLEHHSEIRKRDKGKRDRYTLRVLNAELGARPLHEVTSCESARGCGSAVARRGGAWREGGEASEAGERQPRARRAECDPAEGRRLGKAT